MIFLGKILDKIFQKVPHRFLEKICRKKIAWIFIYVSPNVKNAGGYNF